MHGTNASEEEISDQAAVLLKSRTRYAPMSTAEAWNRKAPKNNARIPTATRFGDAPAFKSTDVGSAMYATSQ
eukprot:CAMPEP_0184676318 /NCGR_PEP_ID=MMETSP0308-20130426/88284_1 /TAXON_ID=38269 /ORGANISM="Gloeochaete witrockiana, Strain SAG 46.84" /LENGTH=71 /DNA_ID=CAMNT_0027124137 /DNA_START=901 /DNA_END=1113 /DNA_ORIENTATION=-